jgi:hypothetical protein
MRLVAIGRGKRADGRDVSLHRNAGCAELALDGACRVCACVKVVRVCACVKVVHA